MQAPAEKARRAWQPLTPRGVAAFADASLSHLWLVQGLVACLVAGVVVWFVQAAWFPVVKSAIESLPEQGRVRSSQLEWPGEAIQLLAENRFLAITVDLNHKGAARSPAHVQLEFGKVDWRVLTLFGTLVEDYPAGQQIAFNRGELVPWWGAWRPALLVLIALGVIVGLFCSWSLLSSLYFVPVWLIGLFADRSLKLSGSWRLSGAALMPGALLIVGGICAYGRGILNVVELTVLFAAHLVLGWTYPVVSVLSLPRALESGLKVNPFTSPTSDPSPSDPQSTQGSP